MADRVDAAVNRDQAPGTEASSELALCEPDTDQLRVGRDAVLTPRKCAEALLQDVRLKFSTITVTNFNLAAHRPNLPSRNARK